MRKTVKADPVPREERIRYHLIRWWWVLGLAVLAETAFSFGAGGAIDVESMLGVMLENALILCVFWVLLFYYRRETYRDNRQVAMIGGLFAFMIIAAALIGGLAPQHPELIPLPLFAMILTAQFNGRVSMIGAMIFAVLVDIQPVFHSGPALFVCLAGGITAALSVRTLRRRSHLYLAVLITAIGYLDAAIALGLVGHWPAAQIGWMTLLGAANALVSASLTILLLPLIESVTTVTTDLTLLELSDPGRPLLRRLSLEAPGTYAHSVAMANLVEAACDAIGANGLLGRVGCYYHDVGKLGNPGFFVENQNRGTSNPHDRITAQQSAKIIRQHVVDGVRLAQEARLPEIITAFIPEHHGTSEINYFLDKAKKSRDGVVNPVDFRYPGPRPRSVETAIAMLADSVEASLRVLDDLTPGRIEDVIDHLVKNKLAAGQLDEAPITLQQIDEVKAEFVRVLSGMYHNRIDYPEDRGGISAGWQGSQPSAPAAGD